MEGPRPTLDQYRVCYHLCRMITGYYQPIVLVSYDQRIDRLYILAGQDLQVLIYPNGDWRIIR
ncbi:hypothetical protein GKIL_2862 [Gloeobacter kilaueensis JS1]|uniref:DUF6888 domain-containing protein n=1 Tax=Gloeobacter kilaueensis (strain ATCC BAA-2537 / CCAP 1431/1 / ULC 316 / JS1) TaxID=1183438 RepID=U5QJP0_GLOK1|nr:hypothetical protein GKIL_2862 [Gloeobacter kilaueensis JS1]